MIDKSEMMALLSRTCPSFRPQTRRASRYWRDEDEATVEATLQELGQYIVRSLDAHDTDTLGAIFSVIERLHLEGNAFVRENAAAHLVDALLSSEVREAQTIQAILTHLGPESLGAWKAREAVFEGLGD